MGNNLLSLLSSNLSNIRKSNGLFAYGSNYTTGNSLNSSPNAVEIHLTEDKDRNNNWEVNADLQDGYIGYSGIIQDFEILATFDIKTASGPGSIISIKLQKKTGIIWTDLPTSEINRYLSGTLDTGAVAIQSVTSIEKNDIIRLFIESSSDVPTYLFGHLQFKISSFL